jgi:hypothetical protein
MHMYSVYQFSISGEARDAVNDLGWEGAAEQFPEVAIHRDVMGFGGSEKFESWMGAHYRQVAEFNVPTLNAAFHEGNVGERPKGMRSISIGDILVDDRTGLAWMVDCDGFNVVNAFGLQEVA